MNILEVLQKIHNEDVCCFVRCFDTKYQNSERNGAYTKMLHCCSNRNLTTDDIFATDWEVYNNNTMEYVNNDES